MRAEEMARLRGLKSGGGEQPRTIRQVAGRDYMKNIVQKFSLEKAFADENTADHVGARRLSRSSGDDDVPVPALRDALRPVRHRLCLPQPDRVRRQAALDERDLCAVQLGLLGAYLPNVLLKNQEQKRQTSIKRAWPDALDLVLLCVEAGMSVEHAFKRVAREIAGNRSELAEELTLTTAEPHSSRIARAPTRTSASAPGSTTSNQSCRR